MNSEEEYWDYIHNHYNMPEYKEEVEMAADYFSVSPSAFEETYNSYFKERE